MNDITNVDIYGWTRFLLSVISVAAWGRIMVLTIQRVRREHSFDRRLWLATAIWLLLEVVLLLFFSSVYQLLHPPRSIPDPVPFAIGMIVSVSIAFGGVVLVSTWPPKDRD